MAAETRKILVFATERDKCNKPCECKILRVPQPFHSSKGSEFFLPRYEAVGFVPGLRRNYDRKIVNFNAQITRGFRPFAGSLWRIRLAQRTFYRTRSDRPAIRYCETRTISGSAEFRAAVTALE